MNILLTSVGRRSYLVKYFKEAIGDFGEIHVANSTDLTPAFSVADKAVKSPLIYDDSYIPFLLEYCRENSIGAIISLFDIDLPILAENKKVFSDNGIEVIVSDSKVIDICNDKVNTADFLLENKINTPKTFNTLNDTFEAINNKVVTYPVIIKPRWGMGSIGVFVANNEQELTVLYNKTLNDIKNSYLKYESNEDLSKSVIIQEKLNGQEYGLDIINDLNGKYVTTIVKEKYQMRAGETDSAGTVDSPLLKDLGEKISKSLKHVGNLDMDVFLEEDVAYVLEMNARFGGGYPFSHRAGINLPKAIVHWLNGEIAPEDLFKEKYNIISHKDIELVTLEHKVRDEA